MHKQIEHKQFVRVDNVNELKQLYTNCTTAPGGGTRYSTWVGRCGPAPHTLTLFKTKIADFTTLFKTEFRFLIPYIRHLTRNQKKRSLRIHL